MVMNLKQRKKQKLPEIKNELQHIYIYIYIQRERERERERLIDNYITKLL